MNRIKAELKWDIESSYGDKFFFNGEDECIRHLDLNASLENCLSTVKRHAIGFLEWKDRQNISSVFMGTHTNYFIGFGNQIAGSTKELFNQYLKYLKTESKNKINV